MRPRLVFSVDRVIRLTSLGLAAIAAMIVGLSIAAADPSTAQQSQLFPGVRVPAGAKLEPVDDTATGAERWDTHLSFNDAVAQEAVLLPLEKSLSGLPWCRTQSDDHDISWIWGRGPKAIIVLVDGDLSGMSAIVIRGGENVGGSAYAYNCPS
jgi:hypothetical protein